MAHALPMFFTILTALFLALVFYALFRSLHGLFASTASAGSDAPATSSDRQALLTEKQSLLQSLRDLEQERDMGKISDNDFEAVNARLRARARDVLRELDRQVAPFRDQAEALVQRLAGASPRNVEQASAPPAPSVDTPAPVGATCSACHTKNEDDAVFCKKCGHKLGSSAAESAS